MNKQTFGPMTHGFDCDWELNDNYFLCDEVLQQRFNIPSTAERLWVTLTKQHPSHDDAIHVLLLGEIPPYGHPHCKLDEDTDSTELGDEAQDAFAAFGDDFYATIYYA